MEFPLNHKTVILIDRGAYQRSASGVKHDVHRLIKARSEARHIPPVAPASKSIWTCCVVASLEYARMAWDMYPGEKLVRLAESYQSSYHSWTVD
jgi:hypothetical protein